MKCLIFDIGGVILYPRLGEWNIPYGARDILGKRAESIGSARYQEAYKEAVGYLDESQLVRDTEAEYALRERFIRSLNRDMQWRMTESEIEALTKDFTYNIDRYGFFEDVKPWLSRWKEKYTLGVLSDALPSILLFLDQYGISEHFAARVISAHVGATKPDIRIYNAVLESLKANACDCVFVDDRVCNLEAAKTLGIHAVQMARSEFMPDHIWDGPVAYDFEQLNAILESGELF